MDLDLLHKTNKIMDFRTKLAKWGYNKGNSIDVETLIDEILPSLLSKQERSYSEEEVIKILYQFHYDLVNSNFDTKEEWFEQFKKK